MATNPISHTYAEVFIIESLTLDDEQNGRFEGKILADVLRLCGKDPKYFYFRTKDELYMLSDLFRESSYRFLHVSCHGSYDAVLTTLDSVPYLEFADVFAGQLKNRRLFMSACDLGNELFAELQFAKNKGMYSVACPTTEITFEHAVAFWSAFYVKLFSEDMSFVKNDQIAYALKRLCDLYSLDFHWAWHNTKHKKYVHQLIKSQARPGTRRHRGRSKAHTKVGDEVSALLSSTSAGENAENQHIAPNIPVKAQPSAAGMSRKRADLA